MDSIVDSSRTVYSDGGIARVALSNLPPWLQQRYNYDPDKAAQFVAEQRRKEQERRDQYGRQSALMQQQAAAAVGQIETVGFTKCSVTSWELQKLPDIMP